MPNWLLISIVGSIMLTVALNLLPMLFPRTTRKAQDRIIEEIRQEQDRID